MNRTMLPLVIFLATVCHTGAGRAQPAESPVAGSLLRVFLDCGACDFNFLREAVPYVHYVRDPEQSDVHLLINSQASGNNGRLHSLDFVGRGRFSGQDYHLEYAEPAGATDDERRRGLTRWLELGVVPYWMQLGMAKGMKWEIRQPTGETPVAPNAQAADPWRRWAFEAAGGGSYDQESQRQSFRVWANLRANRITDQWRIQNSLYLRYDERVFRSEEEGEIVSTIQRKSFFSRVVYSLGDHWSAGLFGEAEQSTFDNLDLGLWVAPAVEFSVFPYREVNRREVTLAYRAGYFWRDYQELTIFRREQEHLWNQALEFRARFFQPWGSLFASVEGSHFLDDIRQHRVEVDTRLDFRITGGLMLELGAELAFIKDQRALPAGGATLEDLLLAQKQLATNYLFSGSIGLRYLFGSAYNDVVNTRL